MWREQVVGKVAELQHPAWGPQHCRRLYALCGEIAERDAIDLDDDILFAVAWLHDIGTFDEFQCGETPPECAARGARRLLEASDFPREKLEAVETIIREHSFEGPERQRAEARVLRDADMLEFIGPIGIVRLLSIAGREEWVPDARSALSQARDFAQRLPGELYTVAAKEIAGQRSAAGLGFIRQLEADVGGLAMV